MTRRIATFVFGTGIALLVAAFCVGLAAIWSHGDVTARLAGTAFFIGAAGFLLMLIGCPFLPVEASRD